VQKCSFRFIAAGEKKFFISNGRSGRGAGREKESENGKLSLRQRGKEKVS
jgi:hypothetical protein